MNLTIHHRYVEDRSQLVEVHTLAEVVKVQRSSDGFKTSTGTIRRCERCRGEKGMGVTGVEPWPVGTWLLIGEVFGDRRVVQLVLCSTHFKELRDKEREIQRRAMEVPDEVNLSVWGPINYDESVWEPVSSP